VFVGATAKFRTLAESGPKGAAIVKDIEVKGP